MFLPHLVRKVSLCECAYSHRLLFFFVEDKRKQTNKLLAALKKLLSNMCFAIRTLTFTSQKRPTSEGMALHRSYFVFVSVCGCENVWSCVCFKVGAAIDY